MAIQLVQYMDLRLTIDNNPPPYQHVTYQVNIAIADWREVVKLYAVGAK